MELTVAIWDPVVPRHSLASEDDGRELRDDVQIEPIEARDVCVEDVVSHEIGHFEAVVILVKNRTSAANGCTTAPTDRPTNR